MKKDYFCGATWYIGKTVSGEWSTNIEKSWQCSRHHPKHKALEENCEACGEVKAILAIVKFNPTYLLN